MSTTNQRRGSKERFWRRTIADRDAQATRFVPVRVVPEQKATGDGSDNGSDNGLELLLGSGRVLRIGRDFDAATLRRLLALLEEGRP